MIAYHLAIAVLRNLRTKTVDLHGRLREGSYVLLQEVCVAFHLRLAQQLGEFYPYLIGHRGISSIR
jgi:hypothetical protein